MKNNRLSLIKKKTEVKTLASTKEPKSAVKKSTLSTTIAPLSPKEKSVLEYIETRLLEEGLSPSFQEICDHFGFASYNSVQNYLKQLSNKGYIYNPAHQKRAIRVLRSSQEVQRLLNNKQAISKGSPRETLLHTQSKSHGEILSLPFLGKVAAGLPLEAYADNETFDVPASLVKNPQKSFVLMVVGSSMIEDGILDGDYLIIQKQSHASENETVVATVDQESTVKRFFAHSKAAKDKGLIELRPANSAMKSQFYPSHQIDIQGVLVSLFRKY